MSQNTNSEIVPVPGSHWDRTIIYNDGGKLAEHRDVVRYVGHVFQDGVKIFHFKSIPQGNFPESQIPVPEHQFPVTDQALANHGDPDDKSSFITYSLCRNQPAPVEPSVIEVEPIDDQPTSN